MFHRTALIDLHANIRALIGQLYAEYTNTRKWRFIRKAHLSGGMLVCRMLLERAEKLMRKADSQVRHKRSGQW